MLDTTISHQDLFETLFSIFSYQFSPEFAVAFLNGFSEMKFDYSKRTKKLKYIYLNHEIQASYRPNLGTFSLSLHAIKRMIPDLPYPLFRVQVQSDVSEFIAAGKSIFAKHVTFAYPDFHVGDEVIVVNENDDLLAIGKLMLPVDQIQYFENGIAVKNRKGINSIKS